jgi:hypothetical protein
MSFKDRLLDIYRKYELNPTSLSRKLGYDSPEKINRLTRDEKNSPSFQIIQDILRVFPQVNARWLIIGEEDMILEDPRAHYGFCKECIKKDGIIEFLKNECLVKDKIIQQLHNRTEIKPGAESQDESGRKAS